jgi:hypothetical protein
MAADAPLFKSRRASLRLPQAPPALTGKHKWRNPPMLAGNMHLNVVIVFIFLFWNILVADAQKY